MWYHFGVLLKQRPSPPPSVQNPPYTLVVVQMQGHLPAANHPETIAAVQQMIERAKHDSAAILFTWFPYYSPLDEVACPRPQQQLLQFIDGYEKGKLLEHFGSDGSWSVRHCCLQEGWSTDLFRICGVNTDASVLETTLGLASDDSVVEVWCHACNTTTETKGFWSKFRKNNVHLFFLATSLLDESENPGIRDED
jgi:hypothetical protein